MKRHPVIATIGSATSAITWQGLDSLHWLQHVLVAKKCWTQPKIEKPSVVAATLDNHSSNVARVGRFTSKTKSSSSIVSSSVLSKLIKRKNKNH